MIDKGDEINIIWILFGSHKASINPLDETTGNQCGKIMYESLIVVKYLFPLAICRKSIYKETTEFIQRKRYLFIRL